MRDSDVRLGFQETLGSLFRAGIALDFKPPRYPRPEPDRPPASRASEGRTSRRWTSCVDNEMFVRQGEYSHGPLVGHRVPCEHALFEARLSEKDFPWLADHRVHHAAIMPAAGYIELVLEALGGAPVYFEVLEFLQPCPIPKTGGAAADGFAAGLTLGTRTNSPSPISSRSYDVDAKQRAPLPRQGASSRAMIHAVDVPVRLADIDRTHFSVLGSLADDRDLYERLEAVLSETFQYGPYLPDHSARSGGHDIDDPTFSMWRWTKALWTTGREEGYVSCPPLFDGSLADIPVSPC